MKPSSSPSDGAPAPLPAGHGPAGHGHAGGDLAGAGLADSGLAGIVPGTLFGALSGDARVDTATGDGAWLQAMLDFEGGLAAALATAGLIPRSAASGIAARCRADWFDAAGLGARAVASGNPVVPLVRDLTALVPESARPYVHYGATSQDALDTAACLVAYRALGPVLADLRAAADACADLAVAHRGTVMAARTILQQALPTTFGLKCAGWLVGLDEAGAGLARVRSGRLAVQYGGAAGTLAALGPDGERVPALLAAELGLTEPALPWHTDRTRVGELAGAIAVTMGVLGKIARDVTLLAQTEVGEVAEATGGGSSAMPHKQNPVRSVLIVAAATRVPGLVATLHAAASPEHERAAGTWHAEWETLTALLRLVGGAAARTRDLLSGLLVDRDRMRHNLDVTGGLLLAERIAGLLAPALGRGVAQDLVAQACMYADGSLRDALLADPTIRAHLDAAAIDEALDPTTYLGSAGTFVDRAVAAHQKVPDAPL